MHSIRLTLSSLVLAALVGCGTMPPLQGARPASAQQQHYGLARSEVVAKTDHMTQHLDEGKSVVYFQNQGGGGVALGLLGPLGVAANIKMIEGVTAGDVEKLKGRIKLDPQLAVQQAALAEDFALQSVAVPSDVKVSPFVQISKTNETTLHVSSVLLFEGMDGQSKWTRRYQYQLPGSYTLDELSTLTPDRVASLQAASMNAYASLLRHVVGERDEAIAQERKITFKSAYMAPRFEFEMAGSLVGEKEGRVWVRTMGGVTAVDPAYIQYQAGTN